ncbi:recQ-mediated genome instability protein 1 [Xyrauchen texanus]|uniref:recQ-mediated genome instability protein 1 n=1 Tax=Xyrauchen texanus TaxID=154827 RepID=UPI0022429D06|nr:recQ-mediated genome instability protein 1 [Xyrauchen texanus]
MSTVSEVQVTQAWLHSEWHIQVPPAWLDACVNWIKEEAEREAVPRALLNQRVLEQWLLTDLRDLAHPVLPAGISEAQKTELNSCYCVQMDSLMDISQPAYTQLQRIRGTDCSNEQVSAVTQETQRPWEAKPTRMLMLQLTDGVHSLEGMEYRPIPALSTNLPPGTKLQIVGPIVVRLGVLLLKAENVKVLGGEVEQLLPIYCQSRLLCGTLGLPEENHPQGEELDDQELLASVEAVEDFQVADSGYDSLNLQVFSRPSAPHLQSQRSQLSLRQQETPISSDNSWNEVEIPDDDFNSIPDDFDEVPQNFEDNMVDEIPEDFDDIPLEELDSVMCPLDSVVLPSTREHIKIEQQTFPDLDLPSLDNHTNQPKTGGLNQIQSNSASRTPVGERSSHHNRSLDEFPKYESKYESVSNRKQNASAITDAPIPRYLCTLQAGTWPPTSVQVLRLQAFIVTLVGNLRSSGGVWKLGATISDGTGYLDVDLCDAMLTNLIGFSAAEARVLRKDPVRRSDVDNGILHCQKELVDMCCMMSIQVDQTGRGVVLSASLLSERECSEIQKRVNERRK